MPRDESSKSSNLETQNDENAYLQPLDVPSAVKSLSKEDMSRFWGTYRSGHYLGLRKRAEIRINLYHFGDQKLIFRFWISFRFFS
jgi:hypothetical protein